MSELTGSSCRATSFAATESGAALTPARLALLAATGVAIVGLEATFRWPLHLPGHHGLEAMALLVFARLACAHPWGATLAAASAAITATGLGAGHGVLTPAFYLLPGLALDLGMRGAGRWREAVPVIASLAALAHAGKPVLRWLAGETVGLQFGSLAAGPLYPLLTHLAFGFAGGLTAALLWRHTLRRA